MTEYEKFRVKETVQESLAAYLKDLKQDLGNSICEGDSNQSLRFAISVIHKFEDSFDSNVDEVTNNIVKVADEAANDTANPEPF